MSSFLGVGNLVLDTVLTTSHFPAENEEMRAEVRQLQPGGNAANTLYVLKQLGHECALASAIAVDDSGRKLLKAINDRGIDTSLCQKRLKGATPTSYVLVNKENGSRTIVHYRDLDELDFEHFAKQEIERFDWLHFEGRNVDNLKGMLNIARTFCPNTPISLELEKPRAGIETLLGVPNLIIIAKHYATDTGLANAEAAIEHVRPFAAQATLVCTWGSEGAWFASPGGPVQHQPAIPVPRVVDTLGAGDTFNAGLLHKLAEGHPIDEAVRFATELAARKIRQQGFDDLLAPLADDQPLTHVDTVTNARATIARVPGKAFSVILIKDGEGRIRAWVNNCPHQHVPLNEAYKVDVNPFTKTMKCSVHDAWFKVDDGECVEGPCYGDHLTPFPIRIDEDGNIFADTSAND
jgi:ketohexokinase